VATVVTVPTPCRGRFTFRRSSLRASAGCTSRRCGSRSWSHPRYGTGRSRGGGGHRGRTCQTSITSAACFSDIAEGAIRPRLLFPKFPVEGVGPELLVEFPSLEVDGLEICLGDFQFVLLTALPCFARKSASAKTDGPLAMTRTWMPSSLSRWLMRAREPVPRLSHLGICRDQTLVVQVWFRGMKKAAQKPLLCWGFQSETGS